MDNHDLSWNSVALAWFCGWLLGIVGAALAAGLLRALRKTKQQED